MSLGEPAVLGGILHLGDITQAQRRAASPVGSAWVAASAGTGITENVPLPSDDQRCAPASPARREITSTLSATMKAE